MERDKSILKKLIVIALVISVNLSFAFNQYDEIKITDLVIKDLSKKESITFLVFGDSGSGPKEDYQYLVSEYMTETCKKMKCGFALMLGDNFYEGDYNYDGVQSVDDPKFQEMFEIPYKGFRDFDNFHFWAMLGNHDYPDENILPAINAQINYSKKSSLWRMPYSYYSLPKLPDWLNIFVFDTELLTEDAGSSEVSGDPKQEKVARDYLCDSKKKGWKLAAGHHPLLTFGPRGASYTPSNKNDMDAMARFIHPILKDCGVKIYFSGHDHVQEHISTSFYDMIVQGAASEANPLWEEINIPNKEPMYFSKPFSKAGSYTRKYVKGRELGFGIVTATVDELEIKFFKVPKDKSPIVNTYSTKITK